MEFTLTFQGNLPPSQRAVGRTKAALRKAFHPQIKATLEQRLSATTREALTSSVDGYSFIAPANAALSTAVELDVLLLSPARTQIGDADNRLKTLIDGLTQPANTEQMREHEDPPGGGPTFCLLSDDQYVQRVNLDTRRWHGSGDGNDSLVVVTARLVLASNATSNSQVNSLFLVL